MKRCQLWAILLLTSVGIGIWTVVNKPPEVVTSYNHTSVIFNNCA